MIAGFTVFFHMAVYSQQILDLAKTLHWDGSNMAGAKISIDDSSIFKCTGKSIVAENVFTCRQLYLYASDNKILQFDINEKAGLLTVITDIDELLLYDFRNKIVVSRRVLSSKDDSYSAILSPSGRQMIFFCPKRFSLAPTDESPRREKFGPDSLVILDTKLQLKNTIHLDGDLVNADYVDDETIVLTLSQIDQMRIFSYDLINEQMEELITASGTAPFVSIDRENKVVAITYVSHLKLVKRIAKTWHIQTLARTSNAYWTLRGIALDKISEHFFLRLHDQSLQVWQNTGTVPQVTFKLGYNYNISDKRGWRILSSEYYFVLVFDDGETHLYKLPLQLFTNHVKQNEVNIINQRLGSVMVTDMNYNQKNMMLSFSDMGGNIYFYDLNLRKKVKELKPPGDGYKYAMHPEDNTILYNNNPSLICLDYKTGIKRELYDGYVLDFDVSLNGRYVAFSPIGKKQIHIVDYLTARLCKKYEVPLDEREYIGKVYFAPDNEGMVITTNRSSRKGDEYPVIFTNDFRIFYCSPGDSLFNLVASLGTEPKIAFSPNSKHIVVSNQSTQIYVYDLLNLTDGSRYISITGCKTPRNLLQRNAETRPQIVAQAFFFNDSIVGITDFTNTICRYNLKEHSFIDPIIDQNNAYKICYPVIGNYYFQLSNQKTIHMKMKNDNQTVFTLEDPYIDFSNAFIAKENKILMASNKYAQVFDISKLSIDTVYNLELVSLYSKMKMDTASGLLLYSDYGRTTELLIDTSKNWTRKYFNTEYDDRKIEDFVVDLERGLLGIVYSVYGSQNLEFMLVEVSNQKRTWNLLRQYEKATFGNLVYDEKRGIFYLTYRSGTNEEYEIEKLERNEFNGRYTYSRKKLSGVRDVTAMHVDNERNRIYLMEYEAGTSAIQIINCSTLKIERFIPFNTKCLNLLPYRSGNVLIAGDSHGYIHFFDKNTYHINSYRAHESEVKSISLSTGDKLLSMGSEGVIKYWNAKDMLLIGSLHFFGTSDFIFINRDGYYYSTKNGVRAIAFKSGHDIISAEQLDMHFNRPDIVLKQLDSTANAKTIKLYKIALQKRRGIYYKQRMFSFKQVNRPRVQFKNVDRYGYAVDTNRLKLDIEVVDPLIALKTLQVWINNVPLYPGVGFRLDNKLSRKKDLSLQVILNEGQNKIEVSSTNMKNSESIRAVRWITYLPAQEQRYQPRLFLFTIAVNKYQNPNYNLRYALNDGRKLTDYLSRHYQGKIITDSFYNNRATKEALRIIRSRLKETKVDDKVIIMLSGHGTLDKSRFEFYFGTHDIDFNNPSRRGISYHEIEGLLKNIPARKKLILIDACHSGLYDAKAKTTATEADTIQINGQNAVIRNAGKIGKTATEIEKKSFELMQEIFWNVEKSDGTFVMAASSGDSYAIELAGLNNGVFTYAMLDALNLDKSGRLSIKQLGDIVIRNVKAMTKGRQNPELRKEYIDSDWNFIQ